MATPAQLIVEDDSSEVANYLRLSFVTGAVEIGSIVLQYPKSGEMIRHKGTPSMMERRAAELNELLADFNAKLVSYCS